MRPVERGPVPLDEHGSPKIFHDYTDARGDLIKRLGEYCSYCEMHLDASLSVEHVKPKVHHPDGTFDWSNFLLACTNCNSVKGSKDVALDDYYWPDQHNTLLVLEYAKGGIVQPRSGLTEEQRAKVHRTLELTGLDRVPAMKEEPSASDRRWINRREAWEIAMISLQHLQEADSPQMRRQIVLTAERGYWSVWMTVFRDEIDIRRRLIQRFPGTAHDCFDFSGDCAEIDRPNGAI
jgi:uncharacterized protein (TIGR02646 family)